MGVYSENTVVSNQWSVVTPTPTLPIKGEGVSCPKPGIDKAGILTRLPGYSPLPWWERARVRGGILLMVLKTAGFQ